MSDGCLSFETVNPFFQCQYVVLCSLLAKVLFLANTKKRACASRKRTVLLSQASLSEFTI